MMLRLVLVGIVAGLGVTIPGREDSDGWLGSAKRWANSAFAEWDTWRPVEGATQGGRTGSRVPECEQCRLLRASIAFREQAIAAGPTNQSAQVAVKPVAVATTAATALPQTPLRGLQNKPAEAFEPIEVGDDFNAGIAWELNRKAEGIALAQSPALPVSIQPEWKAVPASKTFEQDLPDVVWQSSEPIVRRQNESAGEGVHAANTGPTLPIVAEKSTRPVVTSPSVLVSIAQSVAPHGIAKNAPQRTRSADGIPWPTFAPDQTIVPPPARVVQETIVPWPVFAPIEPTPGSEIARAAAPLEGADPSAVLLCTPSPVAAWGRAADLTRQAMRAWLDVLVGTKPVEVTAR